MLAARVARLQTLRWLLGVVGGCALLFGFVRAYPAVSAVVTIYIILALLFVALTALLRLIGWRRVCAYHVIAVIGWAVGEVWLGGGGETGAYLLIYSVLGALAIAWAWIVDQRPHVRRS